MKFTLPALKKPKKGSEATGLSSPEPEQEYSEYDRKVRIPVNAELLKGLPVGASATITLVGEVCEAEAKSTYDGASIRLKITSVETADVKNDLEDLLDDDE